MQLPRGRVLDLGSRTRVMGVLNLTPDSFSDGGANWSDAEGRDPGRAVDNALAMLAAGADLVDLGAESTRPAGRTYGSGAPFVPADEELRRLLPVLERLRARTDAPLSVDTRKGEVARAALAAGADLVNDVWGVGDDDSLARLAADHGIPLVVMHNRSEARYTTFLPELIADLQRAIERALALGVRWDDLIVDPGFGFGKTATHNLELMRDFSALTMLGRPILLGASRKSTLGRVLDLPVEERLEATLATTALGIAGGADLVRVHDVRANVRAARISDAIVRGTWQPDPEGGPT